MNCFFLWFGFKRNLLSNQTKNKKIKTHQSPTTKHLPSNLSCPILSILSKIERCASREVKLHPMKFLIFLLLAFLPTFAHAQTRTVVLPSAINSGFAANDKIPVTFYPAQNVNGQKAPAAILLHLLGGGIEISQRFAKYLAARGVNAAVMQLPYHYDRAIGKAPSQIYVSDDAKVAAQAFNQAASDVSTLADWLQTQPEVDGDKLGIAGVSLGAIITHLAMGRDERLKAGVALVGGGDLKEISQLGPLAKLFLRVKGNVTPNALGDAELREADPLTDADKNRPRRVLMIQAARDEIIPRRASTELWEALGRPPIQWLDIGHYGLFLGVKSAEKATYTYLNNVWNGTPDAPIPRVYVPTIKGGLLFGLDSNVTPAVTFQYPFVRKSNHQSLIHGDLGMSGRGPYAGVGVTVNRYVDLGYGRRLFGDKFRLYANVGVVF